MTTWHSAESIFGDSGDVPMNERETVLLRQVCDPPDPHGTSHGTGGDTNQSTIARRNREIERKQRQKLKYGAPCPHGCGFYLTIERFGQALSTHERACPKVER